MHVRTGRPRAPLKVKCASRLITTLRPFPIAIFVDHQPVNTFSASIRNDTSLSPRWQRPKNGAGHFCHGYNGKFGH
jgi:hypothetical protein